MKKIFIFIIILIFTSGFAYTQSISNQVSLLNNPEKAPLTKMSLGVHGGFAFVKSSTGIAVGLFAEIDVSSFSFVPQANYWKVNDRNNFEMAGIMRLKFDMKGINLYADGGIGINFLTQKDTESQTKVGLDLGGGIEFPNISSNSSIFIDGKYKIIIRDKEDDGNLEGFTLTAGIKFSL